MFLSAQEAADELGVSVATLYAYVSRKQIRSQAIPNTRLRRYWREDVDRLKKTSVVSRGHVLVPETSITLITDAGPYYRGLNAITLSETANLEDVCAILWRADSADAFVPNTFQRPPLYGDVLRGLSGATTIEKACALLPIVERANPRSYDLSPAGYRRTGAEVMRLFAALMCGEEAPSDEPMHARVARRLRAPPGYEDIIRRLLVVAADHELDPSTYAVRAVANTGVTAYQCVLAGLISSMGRRSMFGRADALAAMIGEIMSDPDPQAPILRRLQAGEPVYGFGSRSYPLGDPRAAYLLRQLNRIAPDDPELQRLNKAIEIAAEVMGKAADLAIVLSFVARKLGQEGSMFMLFRLARMSGWIAHAIEQYQSHDLVRPRTIYVGPLPAS